MPGRGHGRAGPARSTPATGSWSCGPAARRPRGPHVDLAVDLPAAAGADPGPPLDADLRQHPPPGRAAGRPAQRAGRSRAERATSGGAAAGPGPPRLDRPRAAPGDRGRAQGRHAAGPGGHRRLELGIDMGAIDLVIQVEAPTSVASGLQRIGRAGHQVGEPSQGGSSPSSAATCSVAAVVAERMHAGAIEETRVPRNPLDVLAQQIVAMVARGRARGRSTSCTPSCAGAYPFADAVARACSRACSTCWPGRYPSRRVRRAAAPPDLGPPGGHAAAPGPAPACWPSPAAAPSPTAACTACSRRPRAGRASASSTRRWSTRAGWARRSCSAPPPGASRTSPATGSSSRRRRASRARCRSGTATRPGRPVELGRALGAFMPRWSATGPTSSLADALRPRRPGRAQPAGLPGRGARGHRRAPADRPPDRRRALPRRARRLAGLRPVALRRPGPRPVGPGHRGQDPRPPGRRGPGHLERRRHRRPPARGRGVAARPTRCCSTPTRSRSWWSASSAARRCSPPASARTRPAPCCCPAAGPGRAPRCGSSASGPPTCWPWRRSTGRSRSCSRPTGSACATSSTCRRWSS